VICFLPTAAAAAAATATTTKIFYTRKCILNQFQRHILQYKVKYLVT